jgi:hypothetical protein
MTRIATPLLAALAAHAFGLAACQDPYQTNQQKPPPAATGTPPSQGDIQQPSRARPTSSITPQAPAGGARAVAVAFARAWSNWDWRTAASQQRALARLAVGRLAAQLYANADAANKDASLARDRPGSRGRIIAIHPTRDRQGVAAIIVTREQTTTDGHADLGGQHHHVYRAALSRRQHGWGVTAWTPLP